METITFGRRAGRHAAEWALANTTVTVPESQLADAERELKTLLGRTSGERPWRSATSSRRRCCRTSASSAARIRCTARSRSSTACASATRHVVVEDKGDVFNSDLTQALELEFLLDSPPACSGCGSRARRAGRPFAPARLPRPRRRELSSSTRSRHWKDGKPTLVLSGDDDEVAAREEEVLMAVDATAHAPEKTIDIALKIWRLDATTGRRALREYEVEAPEWATLLDCLDLVKDQPRRLARLSQELPDDDLRLVRHADGRRRRARLQDADVRHRDRRPRARDLGDGKPADRQGPRRRHGSLLGQVQGDEALPAAGLRPARGRQGAPDLAGADERDPQGVALHQLRLLRLRVQRDGVRSGVHGAAGPREGNALRRRPARRGQGRAARRVQRPSTGSGSAPAATSATSAAPRVSTRATRSRSSAPRR